MTQTSLALESFLDFCVILIALAGLIGVVFAYPYALVLLRVRPPCSIEKELDEQVSLWLSVSNLIILSYSIWLLVLFRGASASEVVGMAFASVALGSALFFKYRVTRYLSANDELWHRCLIALTNLHWILFFIAVIGSLRIRFSDRR